MTRFTAQPTRLLPRQIRVIHASEGVCLHAVSGRLWVTQPNAKQDLFLAAGDSVELWQNGVVIEADAGPGSVGSYVLSPLPAGAEPRSWLLPSLLDAARLARRIASALKRVWPVPSAV